MGRGDRPMTYYMRYTVLMAYGLAPMTARKCADKLGMTIGEVTARVRWLVRNDYLALHSHKTGHVRTYKKTVSLERLAMDDWANHSLARAGERICAACGKRYPAAHFAHNGASRRACVDCYRVRKNAQKMERYRSDPAFAEHVRAQVRAHYYKKPKAYHAAKSARGRAAQKAQRIAARLATVRVVRRERSEGA